MGLVYRKCWKKGFEIGITETLGVCLICRYMFNACLVVKEKHDVSNGLVLFYCKLQIYPGCYPVKGE